MNHWPFFRILAFELEAALTVCDVNIFVFIPAYLKTWHIHLDNVHVFTGEWGQYDLTIIDCDLMFHAVVLHETFTLLMSQKQILLSSWKRSNTGKGLFALLV